MCLRLCVPALLAVALVCQSGCGPAKLNVNQTLPLEAGDAKAIDLDAQPKPQKVNVKFTSSAGDVTVFVFREADAKGEDGLNSAESNPSKALAKQTGAEGTLSVDIPENTATRVIIAGVKKKTDVKLEIKN